MRRIEASLAEEETNLASLTERKTTCDHRLAMAKRELAQRSKDAEKLKLVSGFKLALLMYLFGKS